MDLFQQKHVKGWIPVYQENYTSPERREQRDNKTITVSIEDYSLVAKPLA